MGGEATGQGRMSTVDTPTWGSSGGKHVGSGLNPALWFQAKHPLFPSLGF